MKKRGQIALYIIIAIVIIAVIVVVFIIKKPFKKDEFSLEVGNVESFVKNCINRVGPETIYDISLKGGYIFPPELSTSSGVPYYYLKGKSYMPSKEDIETEISDLINLELFFCTKNFADFLNLKITQGEIRTQTEIKEEEVILNVVYPITITKGEETSFIKDFKNMKIPLRLGTVLNAINESIQKQMEQDSLCLGCVLDTAVENDIYVDMIDFDEETTIFVFRDENSKVNKLPLRFIFANKYKI